MASRLMREVCSDADDASAVLYLSTSDEANQHFYKRFGFEIVGQVTSARADLRVAAGEQQLSQLTTCGMARRPHANEDGSPAAPIVAVGEIEAAGGGGGGDSALLASAVLLGACCAGLALALGVKPGAAWWDALERLKK